MKKKSSRRSKRVVDRVAFEFTEVKELKIPMRSLVWIFRFSSTNEKKADEALATCVEFLISVLSKRCRAALDAANVGQRSLRHIILKRPRLTLEELRQLDEGLAECCAKMRVKYDSIGYGEDHYSQIDWKTLGTLLTQDVSSIGDQDCRKLRFDGLYCSVGNEIDRDYLRFYADGECVLVCSTGTVEDVAKWLRREKAGTTKGEYSIKGATMTAELVQPPFGNEEPTIFKLKGRLTNHGLKVTTQSSFSSEKTTDSYEFHEAKLK